MERVSNQSADSVDTSDCEDGSKEKMVKSFAKQMLKTTLFVGTYQERRFVESLKDYRDVIRIDPGEQKLIQNLKAVQRKISSNLPKKQWVGITSPSTAGAPEGYCLWVNLPEGILGTYWFKIKSVVLNENEFRLKLEKVRPFTDETISARSSTKNGETMNVNQCFEMICDNFKSNVVYFLTEVCTMTNLKNCVIFVSFLLVTIITGSIHIIQYLLEYLLKLLKETSTLVKAVTPIIVTTINVVGRVVYGTIHSIIGLGRPTPKIVYQPTYPQDSGMYYNRKPIGRYGRRAITGQPSVVITEISD